MLRSSPNKLRPSIGGLQALGMSLFLLWLPHAISAEERDNSFELATACPAGFTLARDNQCELNSLYGNYRSPHDSGVGGPRGGLPKIRDGFAPQVIDLGRYLFFDPLLSADKSIACSSCHDPDYGFADGLGRARGINNAVLDRSAPSLWNIGFFDTLLWDGSQSSLEEQLIGPLYADNEMGNRPDQLITDLRSNAIYRDLFSVAFGASEIELDHVYTAITAFESSLISLNSRYDFYAHGLQGALSPSELEGLNVFRSFVSRCGECHTPPLFSNQEIAIIGVPEPKGRPFDAGAGATSGIPSQRGGFRVPSLRNIAKTAPYMHQGNFESLRDTVAFYNGGRGHAVPENENLLIHWHIWEPDLREEELDRLVDFLHALTDEGFMPEIPKRLPSGLTPGRAMNRTNLTSR
jgi:cytochrome c peroxidase